MYGVLGKFGAHKRGQTLEFYSPTRDTFTELETDGPNFAVGVSIPKLNFTGGGTIAVHMYIWDRGEIRQVKFVSPYTIGTAPSARRAVSRMVEAVVAHDSRARVRQGR